jgi:hypothetical protein
MVLVVGIAHTLTVPLSAELPKILVDTGHGGYPITQEKLSEFCDCAVENGFSVDFQDIKAVDMSQYTLVLSANPDKIFSAEDIHTLTEYMIQGGTFFLAGSGDYKNRDHSEVTNPLLAALNSTIRFNDDQVTDTKNNGKPYIPILEIWNPHVLTVNLPAISVYSPQSINPGEAYPLLLGNTTTICENTDFGTDRDTPPNTQFTHPDTGTPVVLLAIEHISMGDLLVSGSWDLFSGLEYPGHAEFVHALLHYIRNTPSVSTYTTAFKTATIYTGEHCRPEVDQKGADILSEILSPGESSTHTIIIGGPQVNPHCAQLLSYLPIPFKKDEYWYLDTDQKVYNQNYGIIAVITVNNHTFLVAAGLGGTGTAGAVTLLQHIQDYSLNLHYNAYGESILFCVSGDTNQNGVQESTEQWKISIL